MIALKQGMRIPNILAAVFLLTGALDTGVARPPAIRTEFDQAEAAIIIMETLAKGEDVSEAQWRALWTSKGYARLIERQSSLNIDEGFAGRLESWLQDPAVHNRAADYRRAVEEIKTIDSNAAGRMASAYLPKSFVIEATFIALIKHTPNSFVFDMANDPTIFLNVDPDKSMESVEAILAHELHHVGFEKCAQVSDYDRLSEPQQWVVNVLPVLGEGLAMLAAAGSPDRHPQFFGSSAEWMTWERDVATAGPEIMRMERYFMAVLDGSLPEDQRRPQLFSFINTADVPQGGAYTVGWKMAAAIERHFGRQALVDTVCDYRKVLKLYNRAVREVGIREAGGLITWSDEFLDRLYPN
jgi:hypothetical protein